MATALPVALGAALMLILVADVFLTVFHPQARGGPINRMQNRIVWRTLKRLAPREGRVRRQLLGVTGPLTAVMTVVTWVVVATGAMALVYRPFIAQFHSSPGSMGPLWSEALYYSAYITSTLGLGDLVPRGLVLRLVTAAHGIAGFMIFSVAITYVLSVYRENSLRSTLASDIAHALDDGAIETWNEERRAWAAGYARQFSSELSHVNSAHAQYPILHYFRSVDREDSLPLQIGTLLVWLRRLEEIDYKHQFRLFEPPSPFRALRGAIETYLIEVTEYFLPSGDEADEENTLESQHDRLMRYLDYEPRFGTRK